MPHVRKGDEGKIDGVEHQLNRHEDADEIAFDKEGRNPDGEQHGGENEIRGDRNLCGHGYCSFRASTTAPRMATRIRTEVTSNGSRSLVKSVWLISEILSAAFERSPPMAVRP